MKCSKVCCNCKHAIEGEKPFNPDIDPYKCALGTMKTRFHKLGGQTLTTETSLMHAWDTCEKWEFGEGRRRKVAKACGNCIFWCPCGTDWGVCTCDDEGIKTFDGEFARIVGKTERRDCKHYWQTVHPTVVEVDE
jgi:hypothetical protein